MFQNEKITRLAVVVFGEEGRISISGQGTLKKVFLSAYLSEGGTQILPPREHFYFNRNRHVGIDATLVRKVSIYFILSEKEAEEQVRSWEEMVIRQTKEQRLKFGDYGTFHFEDHLDFISETLYYYQYLPPVAYKSVGSNLHGYPATELVASEPVAEVKASKSKILVPAMWALLLGLFGFAFYLWSGPLDLLIDQQTELNTRLVNVAPESYTRDKDTEYYNDTDELSALNHSTVEGQGKSIVGSEDRNTEITVPSPEVHKESISPAHENTNSTLDKNPDATITSGNVVEASSRCTLIVGAFADANNVDRMVKRLIDFDVEVVTVEGNTLTLVGANISCSNSETINALKSKIDNEAWIYKK